MIIKEFRIGDLFVKLSSSYYGQGTRKSAVSKQYSNEYCVPIVYCKYGDNGIMYWAKKGQFETHNNVISIIYNGAIAAGLAYAHKENVGILAESYLIELNNNNVTFETLLYLTASIKKVIYPKYSRENLATWAGRVEDDIIFLPIQTDENGMPIIDTKRIYHTKGYIPDWSYMDRTVNSIKCSTFSNLNNFLNINSLNECDIDKEEVEILSSSSFITRQNFSFDYLFDAQTGDVDLQQKDINGKGCYFINSGLENDGIKGKTDRLARVFSKNTITIDFWGNAFYRPFEYKLATHNHVFSLSGDIIKNELVGLYLVSQMMYLRKVFSYAEMGTWNKIKVLFMSLPIKIDENKSPVIDQERKYHKDGFIPDFDYMEKYIRAMQKKVIADVVKYKDEIISRSKKDIF